MKLFELLNETDWYTNICLYKSSTKLWIIKNETLISNKATVQELSKSKYNEYEVIGVTTEANALRITIYNGKGE